MNAVEIKNAISELARKDDAVIDGLMTFVGVVGRGHCAVAVHPAPWGLLSTSDRLRLAQKP